jgi:hypothetical protein
MKNIFVFVFLFTSIPFLFSQDISELKITNKGVPQITISAENFTAKEIYDKALIWVNANFSNPKDAIKENIENEFLKIEGFKLKAWYYTSMGIKNYNHMLYNIEFTFFDGSLKVNYTILQFYINEGLNAQYNYEMFFKKDGFVRSKYKDAVPSLEATMNELLFSFYNFLTGESVKLSERNLNKYDDSLKALLKQDSIKPSIQFDAACFYSLIEDKEKAYNHLSKAVTYGYKDFKNIQKEPDLKWLRHQNDYKPFVENGYKFNSNNKEALTKDFITELRELAKLKEEGIITEKEFEELKAKILTNIKNE